jgi:diguanylate cyclase (GGDEF)-like protein
VAVNAALAVEIEERHHLEDQLAASAIALSESRAAELKAKRTALHDAVTGLPNLTLFNDRLNTALAQAQRHGWRLAVMFIDLDDFKSVNDLHGHQVGDRILQTVARRLQTMVRSSDTLSRRSGDEFLFLMLEAKDKTNVESFAARIVANICEPCDIDGLQLTVNASVGLAIFPEDGLTAQALLARADSAMYGVKEQHHSSAPPTRAGRA